MKKEQIICIPFFIIFWIITCSALADDIYVKTPVTASSIQTACQTASDNVATGPHRVIIPNGTYDDLGLIQIGSTRDGQLGKELTLTCAVEGECAFTGQFQVDIYADYWIVDGITFDSIEGENVSYPIDWACAIRMGGNNGRITDCVFKNWVDVPADSRTGFTIWVARGDDIQIDHNKWDNCYGMGIYVGDGSFRTIIEYNYFKDGKSSPEKRLSPAMQVGGAEPYMDQDLNTVVRNNLFHTHRGMNETISNKSSGNTYQYNVFIGSRNLALRYGQDCLVDTNWFFNLPDYPGYGVTIFDGGHKISNNYFSGLTGTCGIWLFSGNHDENDRGVYNTKYPAHNIEVVHNTFADMSTRDIFLIATDAVGYTYPVHDVVVKSNIFENSTTNSSSFVIRQIGSNRVTEKSITWKDNIFDKGNLASAWTGWTISPPIGDHIYGDQNFDSRSGGYWENLYILPSSDSIALAAGTYDSNYTTDFDGHTRPSSTPDIGCDQYSATNPAISPVTEAEVGPNWMRDDSQLQAPTNLKILQ